MSSSQIAAKIVLLGKTNSGKTCLMERYLHQRYSEYVEAVSIFDSKQRKFENDD